MKVGCYGAGKRNPCRQRVVYRIQVRDGPVNGLCVPHFEEMCLVVVEEVYRLQLAHRIKRSIVLPARDG